MTLCFNIWESFILNKITLTIYYYQPNINFLNSLLNALGSAIPFNEEGNLFHCKHQNNLLPIQICNHFENSSQISHNYGLRSRSRNDPPRFLSRTKTGEKSLQFRKTQIWNEIPSEIKSCEFFNAFKKAYKKFLIETTVEGT